jgi:alkylation response protein AidB-like acyl-CoA dehydrogenase
MDFSFTAEELSFRAEVRNLLKEVLPPGWKGVDYEEGFANDELWCLFKEISRKLGAKGWLALGWPKKYGGQERGHVEGTIFSEEIAYQGACQVIDAVGAKWLAPTIMMLGTEEQKQRHLGPIARGGVTWCEGYSEPQAGSDLASIQTRAVEQGDYYVLNGQKVWTSGAHRAEWCFLLARTAPNAQKSKGISFFLMDMKTPGIEVRPLLNILGQHTFNEVFLDNVKVPKENLVGGVNNGWLVANTLLSFERTFIELLATGRRLLDNLVQFVYDSKIGHDMLRQQPQLRHRLAEASIEMELGRILNYRVAWMQDQQLSPDSEAARAKVFTAEFLQHLTNTGMQITGLYGCLVKDSVWSQLDGMIVEQYLSTLGLTIAGGTSEVLRTLIATRGLGLPRS